jgi:hypothetical protein
MKTFNPSNAKRNIMLTLVSDNGSQFHLKPGELIKIDGGEHSTYGTVKDVNTVEVILDGDRNYSWNNITGISHLQQVDEDFSTEVTLKKRGKNDGD